MTLETDNLHVVIRVPIKRPQGFIEPPLIHWTDEMEHKLWQYMSQKNTDWKTIANQLGVPTSYVIRHAAFIYETQLRGIHHQLRLSEVNKAPLSVATTQSPYIRRNASTRSRPPSRRQTPTSRPPSAVFPSTPSRAQSPNTAQQTGPAGAQQQKPSIMTHVIPQLDKRDESMVLSTISNIAPRMRSESLGSMNDIQQTNIEWPDSIRTTPSAIPEKRQSISSIYESAASHSTSSHQPHYSPKGSTSQVATLSRKSSAYAERTNSGSGSRSKSEDLSETLDASETARRLAQIQEQMEELAFLPAQKKQGDSHSSLRGSGSLVGENRSKKQLQSTSIYIEERGYLDQSRPSSGKGKSKVTDTSQRTTSSQLAAAAAVEDHNRPATGSFTTNLSDSLDSVTQSALEDAFMSNYNNVGSKMSSLAFSRKYPPSQ